MKKVDAQHIADIQNSLGKMAEQARKGEKVQLMESKLTTEEKKLLLAEAKKYGFDEKLINDYTER